MKAEGKKAKWWVVAAAYLLVASGQAFAGPQDQPGMAEPTRRDARRNQAVVAFRAGQLALQSGNLAEAEAEFKKVLALDAGAAAAYSNLGVVEMRRKNWDLALQLLTKAEKLDPQMAGIRLNIGLVQYHRGEYAAARAPLASVLEAEPAAEQPRYLLGLCNVFTQHFAEAVEVLEPLWPKMSENVLYLYVLDIAARGARNQALDEKTLSRMVEIGSDTAEFHLIMGKAYIYRGEAHEALAELGKAAQANPNLPYLHLNLGIAHTRLGEEEKAEEEFKKDIALEPDLADSYEQLGQLYLQQQRDPEAEAMFRAALQRNAKLPNAYMGLAKLEYKEKKDLAALRSIQAALRLDDEMHGGHFLKGRILTRLGREREAKVEFAMAQKALNSGLDKDRKTIEDNFVPSPELKGTVD